MSQIWDVVSDSKKNEPIVQYIVSVAAPVDTSRATQLPVASVRAGWDAVALTFSESL